MKRTRVSHARQEFARRKALEAFDETVTVTSECDPTSLETTSCPSESYCVPVDRFSSSLGGLCARLSVDLPTGNTGNTGNTDDGNENPGEFDFQKCNPSSQDPDVGILSCQDDSICVRTASVSKSLGGLCVPLTFFDGAIVAVDEPQVDADADGEVDSDVDSDVGRPAKKRGYLYCDPSSPYFGFLDCDCSQFDTETMKGSFSCSYAYCFGGLSECCAETCADVTMAYSAASDSDGFTYETCYVFSEPYTQTFCHGQTVSSGTSSCFGSFDDVSCESCQVANSTCSSFSCSAAGLQGELCMQDFYPPVLTSCYADCASCPLCPDTPNNTVSNHQALVGLSDFTCEYVNYLGLKGMWGGPNQTECVDVRQRARATCCADIGTQPSAEATEPPREPVETSSPDTAEEPTQPTVSSPDTNDPQPPQEQPDEDDSWPPPIPEFGSNKCAIRIQTSRCDELLVANAEAIPCRCKNQCIAFVDDKFDKCDSGTIISGAGSIVTGCTFDMVDSDLSARCHSDGTKEAIEDTSTAAPWTTTTTGLVVSVLTLFLMAISS